MPVLRFARDKRGYETTSLVHAGRRQGRSRQRILYWFRTPPGVKVGRPALDEAAIRWIEEHNPDIEFDWAKILEATAPASPPPEDLRARRSPRDKPDRRSPAPQQTGPAGAVPAASDEEDVIETFEQLTQLDADQKVDAPVTPVEHVVGGEDLTRLRARYAELQVRITERGGDEGRIVAFRAQAEAFNPDSWVTEEEARKGLAEFEPKIRDLRAALGLRRRRRSRRGGRRRSGRQENEA